MVKLLSLGMNNARRNLILQVHLRIHKQILMKLDTLNNSRHCRLCYSRKNYKHISVNLKEFIRLFEQITISQ
jgi:hypothetical protein